MKLISSKSPLTPKLKPARLVPHRRSFYLIAGLLLLFYVPAEAAPIIINFDSLSGMPNSPGTSVPVANRLSDQLVSTTGAVFSSAVGYAAVVDLRLGLGGTTTSFPLTIGGVNAVGNLSYGTPVLISFFDPAHPTVLGITDFVQIRGDTAPNPSGATATLEAFDLAGLLLGSVTANDSAAGLTLTFTAQNIHSVRISQNSAAGSPFDGTIGLDDLSFNPVQPVPEPSSVLLLLSGAFLCLRRRSLHTNERNG